MNPDRYQIRYPLGKGGCATVYLAKDRHLGRSVAVKCCDPGDAAALRQLQTEKEVLTGLRHPMLPEVYDADETSIVMEYVEGITLREVMLRQGAVEVAELYGIGLQLADWLQMLHEAPGCLLYLDVKPENVIRLPDGTLKVIDYGTVTPQNKATCNDARIGTFGYAAQEQWEGGGLDVRTDLYALGALLYDLAVGRSCAQSPYLRLHLPEDEEIVAPVRAVLAKCLEKHPQDRYASAAAFADAWKKSFDLKAKKNTKKTHSDYVSIRSVRLCG